MKTLYHKLVGDEFCNKYAKVSKDHYLYEDNFHKQMIKDTFAWFQFAMKTEYPIIHTNKGKST